MRGNDAQPESGMFSYVSLEERVPAGHPLRAIRRLADQVLLEMKAEFDVSMPPPGGRRFRPSGFSAPCYCRCFIRSAASAC